MDANFRVAQVRNAAVALVNGAITLVILLIAPLGLAAVMMNTLLVMVATYFTGMAADRVVGFLQPARSRRVEQLRDDPALDRLERREGLDQLQQRRPDQLDRY
ncbi:CRISPR-associated protein Csx18 [Egbenema bharatensis]|uniref:CRISPR-associated protein Csx18 n=1 Tax=Egbenema bharatensis TaxID=3463334 RepID=UPI003A839248